MKFLRKLAILVPPFISSSFELGCGGQYRPVANPILSHGGQPQNAFRVRGELQPAGQWLDHDD